MNRSRLIVLVAALVSAVGIVAAGSAASTRHVHSQPAGSPAVFLAKIVRLLAANRYAEAWPSLNSLQQAIAPLQAYVACESQTPVPGQLVSLHVLAVRHEPASVLPISLRSAAPQSRSRSASRARPCQAVCGSS